MTIETVTPETAAVDAPASMESILAEFETGAPAADTTESVVRELVEEAEEGDAEQAPETEDDATDAEEEAEETAKEEPETDDEPEPAYKVKVNGEEADVPLSELIKGYSRTQDYTAKTMALAEERRTLEAKFANELREQVELFEALDPILSEAKNIDWQKLAQDDPTTYVQLKAAVDERQKAVTDARERIGKASEGQTEAEKAATAATAQAETQALINALPELADPQAMTGFANNAVAYLRGAGFEDGDIAELTDHKALIIIDKARRYDEIERAKATLPAKKVVPKSQVKALKSDGSDSSKTPRSRFPANAPRERQLEHIVQQFLEKG